MQRAGFARGFSLTKLGVTMEQRDLIVHLTRQQEWVDLRTSTRYLCMFRPEISSGSRV